MNNLILLYQQRLNLRDATFTQIDHQDATVALVYSITQPNAEQLILKVCPRSNDFLREKYFLTHFADKLPVPHIISWKSQRKIFMALY